MRYFLAIIALMLSSFTAQAIEAPAAQIPLDANRTLRGHFTEEHQISGVQNPIISSGHFTVAPARGLIWGIEKPFPTSTIITPNGAAQDIGGLAMKLSAKNIRHLYDVIGAALAGNWNKLETDFIIAQSAKNEHWQMLLTPRNVDRPKLSYASITVSGSRFVESIILTKADGSNDVLSFTDAVLSPASLTVQEVALFNEMGQ